MYNYSNFKIKGVITKVLSGPKQKKNCDKQWWEVDIEYKNVFEKGTCTIAFGSFIGARGISEGDPFFLNLSDYKETEVYKHYGRT